ncbi:glycosyltransferase [Sphingobium phenoxybenzoativorans]|uniref:glycosyltransferase n=1 Tax=Sphingobium phenoxybenzoativorans TaxID=1592790 RepID=UPI00087349ED|nr:glycosyltransferase [Sphingobium phenoxybenzoativorans]
MASKLPRKRILFVINSLAGGGAERVLLELIGASRQFLSDYDISLALLDDEAKEYTPPPWLHIHQLNGRFKLIQSIRELLKLARAERPDLTLSFLTRANIASVAVARMLGHKAIISERVNTSGHFAHGIAARLSKAMVRTIYPHADRIIAVSDGIAEDLERNFSVPGSRLVTIPNPVDSDRINLAAAEEMTLPVDGPYIVAVSRLSKNKNVILLTDALAASGLKLPLVILGQGPEHDEIKARAKTLGVEDRIVLAGFAANPYPVMRAASCYVSASNAEGFPNGLVEALALGLPVVATNCPSGPSEILAKARREEIDGIHIGENGILVPQNDALGVAEGLRLALEPERARALAIAGPRRAGDYSLNAARDLYWKVIEQCLGEARSTPPASRHSRAAATVIASDKPN